MEQAVEEVKQEEPKKRRARKKRVSASEGNAAAIREAKLKEKGVDGIRNIVIYCSNCGKKCIDQPNTEANHKLYRHEVHGKVFKENYRCIMCFPVRGKNGKMVSKMKELIKDLGIEPWW